MAVGRIDDIGWTVIAHFACERGKDSEVAIMPFTGPGIRGQSLKEQTERSLRIRITNGLEALPVGLVRKYDIVEITVVCENLHAAAQLAYKRLRVGKLDGTPRGMAYMGNDRIALDWVIVQALYPGRERGRRRFTNEAYIPSLAKCHAPAVAMDAGMAAVARQLGER